MTVSSALDLEMRYANILQTETGSLNMKCLDGRFSDVCDSGVYEMKFVMLKVAVAYLMETP